MITFKTRHRRLLEAKSDSHFPGSVTSFVRLDCATIAIISVNPGPGMCSVRGTGEDLDLELPSVMEFSSKGGETDTPSSEELSIYLP